MGYKKKTVSEKSFPQCVCVCSTDIVHYYLYCNQTLSNPFQQVRNVSHNRMNQH